MKKYIYLLSIALLLFGCANDNASIEKTIRLFYTSLENGDGQAVDKCLYNTFDSNPLKSATDWATYQKECSMKYDVSNIKISIDGNNAIAVFTRKQSFLDKTTPINRVEEFRLNLIKFNDGWKICYSGQGVF